MQTNTLWLTGHHLAADIYAFTTDLEDPHVRYQLISAAHALSVSLKPPGHDGHDGQVTREQVHQLCNGLTVLLAVHSTTLAKHTLPTREWLKGIEIIRVLVDDQHRCDCAITSHEMHAIVLPPPR